MRKASSAQVGMLLAIAGRKGIKGKVAFLDWLEYDSNLDIRISDPYDLDAGLVSLVKMKLETLPDSE